MKFHKPPSGGFFVIFSGSSSGERIIDDNDFKRHYPFLLFSINLSDSAYKNRISNNLS
jgi:hypothetical protein